MNNKEYKRELRELQIELVKLHRDVIANGEKLLVILEGRDAAGKDGTIKRFVQHLSPRETRVVALPAPSDRDKTLWYFQRYVPHLPAAQEIVLFNRSWYNRAGVERVMGFCTDDEYERFFDQVVQFEDMLVGSGMRIFKYYLDISRDEQEKRLAARQSDPLKTWKLSPIDASALSYWDKYTEARDVMFTKSHHSAVPWHVIKANHKKQARLGLIRHVLKHTDYADRNDELLSADPGTVFEFKPALLKTDAIER